MLYHIPSRTVEALLERLPEIESRRHYPLLRVGYAYLLSHWDSKQGPPPPWEEYVPEYARPRSTQAEIDPEVLHDVALAFRIGRLGTEEIGRLQKRFGREALTRLLEKRNG